MKKGILFILLLGAASASLDAQSLKDLLYGGKLKKDSSGVIRKTDDLSKKIDTGDKKAIEPEKQKIAVLPVDSAAAKQMDTLAHKAVVIDADSAMTAPATEIKEEPKKVPPKSNTRILKEITDSLVTSMQNEISSNKKLKKGTYFLIVEYDLDTNGSVSVTNVISTPENAFLQADVKQRLESISILLSPVLDSAGQPRKVKRKHSFTITKE